MSIESDWKVSTSFEEKTNCTKKYSIGLIRNKMKIYRNILKIYPDVGKLTCQLSNGFIINNIYNKIIINIIYNLLLVNKNKNVKNNMIINVKKCQKIGKA